MVNLTGKPLNEREGYQGLVVFRNLGLHALLSYKKDTGLMNWAQFRTNMLAEILIYKPLFNLQSITFILTLIYVNFL